MSVDYRSYMPKSTSRVRENVEWSIRYAYNATDKKSPRALIIGDSICYAYQRYVRKLLEDTCNVSFWASSACVTDPSYLRMLDFETDDGPFDVVCFNNGLHSLTTDRGEWEASYRSAVRYLRDKMPETTLLLTLCTPLKDPALTAISRELDDFAEALAEEQGLGTIDLFSPMDVRDRETDWSDCYHFKSDVVEVQAGIVSDAIRAALGDRAA